MIYRCIGKNSEGEQCPHGSETPTNPAHPEWGFLCQRCANEPARKGSRNNTNGIVLERPATAQDFQTLTNNLTTAFQS
jgi:hypothetical protein